MKSDEKMEEKIMNENEKKLMETLRKLDGSVRTKKTEQNMDDVIVRIRKSGNEVSWTVVASEQKKKMKGKGGKGIDSLQAVISETEQTAHKESFLVLCRTGEERTDDGRICTSWAVCDPIEPVEIEDGLPYFQMKKVCASEAETAYFRETGVCLESESGEMLPLTKAAVYSAGKVFTLGSALRALEKPGLPEVPLAEALILSRKLPESEYTLILRKGAECSPIIGFAGSRYTAVSQEEIVAETLALLRRHYVCDVTDWHADMEDTYVRIEAEDMKGSCYFIIRDSISPMRSISVTAGIRIDGTDVEVKTVSSHHWKAFAENGGMAALVETLPDELERSRKLISGLEGAVRLREGDLSKIVRLIGKGRAEAAALPEPGTYNGSRLFASVVSAIEKQDLKAYQKERLPKIYEALIQTLVNGKEAD